MVQKILYSKLYALNFSIKAETKEFIWLEFTCVLYAFWLYYLN